jgi:soluble lytic murein transglycosylase
MRMIRRTLLVSLLLCLPALGAAASLADRRSELRAALEHVERGKALTGAERRRLRDHPLYSYVEYAELRRGLAKASKADIADFRSRHPLHPLLPALTEQWQLELARRQDWPALREAGGESANPTLRCHQVSARLRGTPSAADWEAALALWRNGGSAPAACDAVFAALAAAGKLDAAARWERIELAAASHNPGLMRFVARGLDAAAQAEVEAYARFIENASGDPSRWPRSERSARMLAHGIERLARRDSDRAEALVDAAAKGLPNGDGLARARYSVALWTAASYEPAAARRFAAVPATAFDARLHEWRAREALAREDWAAARAAIAAMPAAQQAEPRWRYVAARLDQLAGNALAADAQLAALAGEAHYHGFLAADRSRSPYALCPLDTSRDPAVRQAVESLPGLQRALELHALGRHGWALAEWNALLGGLDDERRRVAVERAVKAGWTDRAVFDLARGDDLRYYRLRFPLAHQRHLTREAEQRGLDPAWVAALIRAESAWNPQARSHADARGLMQLLPGTAADTARRLGLGWNGAAQLYQPQSNITLGTAYLADMLARKAQQPYLATAAYNAGPAPIARWRARRPPSEVDLWVETIPYKETRDYVVRVMAFSVIYDWRLGRDAYPLSRRLLAQPDRAVARQPFHCPTPATVASTSP